MIQAVNPYLNFPGTTEEAFDFYHSVFGGDLTGVVRFRDFPEPPAGFSEEELDLIANIGLPLGNGAVLMGTDVVGPWSEGFTVGTNSYIHLEVDDAGEARRIFDAISDGGSVEMPMGRTEWAELYGSCRDRFGVQWMVGHTGSVTWGG